MTLIECILLLLVVGTLNIVCFFVGANVGQKVDKDKPVELPNINPMKAIREREDRRIAEKEQRTLDTILENIDNYNGTSQGQKDVPR